ncbi:Peptidyl-prolyl cis-trans isomerase FKBP53 [Linum grandiflorum]
MTGFWGIEVKPGESCTYQSENEQETLYITQATLGVGSATDRTILQCSVDEKAPVFLCSLLPEKTESCALNLVFRDDEFVSFSVVGETSVHISGYVAVDEGGCDHEDEQGEDIAMTDSDESSDFEYDDEFDEEDDDDFIEDVDEEGFNALRSSHPRTSGVVIEEIVDDEKPETGDGDGLAKGKKQNEKKKKKKNNKLPDDDSGKQIVLKSSPGAGASVLESEDEDGFPVSQESKPETNGEDDKSKESKKKKRKVKATEPDSQPAKKKKKKQTKKSKEEIAADMDEDDQKEPAVEETQPVDTDDGDERQINAELESAPTKTSPAKKQKKKKNKKANADEETNVQTVPSKGGEAKKSSLDSDEKQSASKYSKERTLPNGLVIEDLAMGNPNGKRASAGNQVSMRYIGKLKKNGKIFDSNMSGPPFKFRLGRGEVIKGWDVGVDGMRVGDKRRLTIPPSMGYGHKGMPPQIPQNAWLMFDVELVNVR